MGHPRLERAQRPEARARPLRAWNEATRSSIPAGDHTIVPYVNSGYAIIYFASEGDLFTHAQARVPLILEGGYRLAALLLSVPVWQLMGLM